MHYKINIALQNRLPLQTNVNLRTGSRERHAFINDYYSDLEHGESENDELISHEMTL